MILIFEGKSYRIEDKIDVPIVQWIEHSRPKGRMCVRLVLGTQKKVIEKNNLHLVFSTGDAVANITGSGMEIKKSDVIITGTLASIQF